jgi:site-specific DNA-methyltransferase (adenine-specific)
MNKVHLIDNMEFMKGIPDKYYELAIVDPPYRDTNQPTKDMRANGSMLSLEGRPSKGYWKELYRISKEQIIWGANNFQLPQFMGFVVWKKLTISEVFTMSMAEIASISHGL